MADNVAITAGSGTSIATDDVSSVHYQKIKLYAGSDGDARRVDQDEDSAHTSGDPGVPVLAVRRDTPAVGSGTDGDYSTLNVGPKGELWTAHGTRVETLAISTGLETASITGVESYVGVYLMGSDSLVGYSFSVGGTRDSAAVWLVGFTLYGESNYYTGGSSYIPSTDFEIDQNANVVFVPLTGAETFTITSTAVVTPGTLQMVFVRHEPPWRAQAPKIRGQYFNSYVDSMPMYEVAPSQGANAISLASTATSDELLVSALATDQQRLAVFVTNTDANMLYIRYGLADAEATDFTFQIPSGATWEMPRPIWQGSIQAIWAAAGSGSAIGSEIVVD
jgi:hypothetical protein